MSIVFRLKYALGLIPSADRLDASWDKLVKMRNDLELMENSKELKHYEELKNLIESVAFKHHQREIESLQYKGSTEENLVLEQKALSNSSFIKNFNKLSNSGRLERFDKIAKGHQLKRFLLLQKEVLCDDFLNRKAAQSRKAFINSPDYKIYTEFKQLKKSDDIRFWNKFGQSEKYKNYLSAVGSDELKRLDELCVLTSKADFNERIAYLKDKKRFRKSAEYKQILSYKELDNSRFMSDYRKLKKDRELDFFNKWEITLDENFEEKSLNTKKMAT